ncbi:MAG: FGGY-family carbohydrate kinase [Arachnia propionica]|uniref:xylulokinase n=1 Tax=Arachnia propionica TaxID=1750 RepID=UPI0026F7E560|nr:FGGY-family carbohydrate kinase [Arachnia propionica]
MTNQPDPVAAITEGRAVLGIEFGSTRIKAVLVGDDHRPIATGSHDWENRFQDRVWTYSLDDAVAGMQAAHAALVRDVRERHGVELTRLGAVGISGMMHGHLALDADDRLLTPFRTWRNTMTKPAASQLSELFGCTIPQRWSIAHLWQAVLNDEPHVAEVAHITTLAGWIHWRLTGRRVVGACEASGMFPVDGEVAWQGDAVAAFDRLAAERGLPWRITDLLPRPLPAGAEAGTLTQEGALLLDPTGTLRAGAVACPPEGDAGTGMVATNTVAPRTGNVSAGTSIFAMIVLDQPPAVVSEAIEMIATPAGHPVAMVHCNNGASEVNTWAGIFAQFVERLGVDVDAGQVFETLFTASLDGAVDAGGLVAFNYLSGEHLVGLAEGRPLVLRTPDSELSLANFMRAQLYSVFATLRVGLDVLVDEGGVHIDSLFAHGGIFRTPGVAQRHLAAATKVPVTVGETAAEGGAWGIALLAAFMRQEGVSLTEFLAGVFADAVMSVVEPDAAEIAGFETYHRRQLAALPVERAAVDHS